jgi:zinc transporter
MILNITVFLKSTEGTWVRDHNHGDVRDLSSFHQPFWIHIEVDNYDNTAPEFKALGLHESVLVHLLSADSRPCSLEIGEDLVGCFRCMNTLSTNDPDDLVPLRLLMTSKGLLTLTRLPVKSVAELQRDISHQKNNLNHPHEILIRLLQSVNRRLGVFIESMEEKTYDMENTELQEEGLHLIQDKRRAVLNMRRYLLPQIDAYEELLEIRGKRLKKSHQSHFTDMKNRTQRYIEVLDLTRLRLDMLQDEYRISISEDLNRNMMKLSMVANIFLPLSLLSGLWGMNVGGVPFSGHPHGFSIICLIMFSLGLIAWFIVHKKLQSIPRKAPV